MASRSRLSRRGATAQQAAAEQGILLSTQPVYVIKCIRESKLLETDEDSFEDRYNEEVDEAQEEIDDCVKAGDGCWVFDMGNRAQHALDKPVTGLTRSPGVVQVFGSKETANAQAALVWESLQKNHPFDSEVPVAKPAKKKRKRAASGDSDEDSAAEHGYRYENPDGTAMWEREQQCYVDPWGDELKNLVSSEIIVEVVEAQLRP